VHPRAELGPGVFVGPGCVIGESVADRKNTRLEANVHIAGRVRIGEDCRFSPFSALGGEPQDTGYKGEDTEVVIGDRNIFREFVTVHRGTAKGGGTTTVGSDNYFMAYSHIAHDCRVGQQTIFTNAATLGGTSPSTITPRSAPSAPFISSAGWGKYAFIGGFRSFSRTSCRSSGWPGMRPVLLYGLNSVGLRRRGFSRERLGTLKDMFKILFYSKPEHHPSRRSHQVPVSSPAGPRGDHRVHRVVVPRYHQEGGPDMDSESGS